jgi:hypothetical protein
MNTRQEDTKYYMGIAVLVALILAFVVYAFYKESGRIQVDKITGCPGTSNAALVILVDRTEDYTRQGISELQSRVLKEIDGLQSYDRVSIFSVSEISKRNLKPLFDKCVPDLNPDPAVANKNQVMKEFKRDFLGSNNSDDANDFKKGTVLHAISKRYNDSDESPVAQVITDLTLDTDRFSSIENKKFLIFSDMLEHTDKFSLYAGCTSQEDVIARFKESRVNLNARPKFNGADVVVNLLPSSEVNSQSIKCRSMLWNWFFSGGGANSVVWHDMPGI